MWSERASRDFESNIEKRRSDGSDPEVLQELRSLSVKLYREISLKKASALTFEFEGRGK